MTLRRINVGVLGCGAVAELCYLPAIQNIPTIKIKALADVNRKDIKLKGKTVFKEDPIRIPVKREKGIL